MLWDHTFPQLTWFKAVKLLKTSGVYFLNDSNNKSLQRVYGISFPDKELMNEYLRKIELAKERDHRKLGNEFEIDFFF